MIPGGFKVRIKKIFDQSGTFHKKYFKQYVD